MRALFYMISLLLSLSLVLGAPIPASFNDDRHNLDFADRKTVNWTPEAESYYKSYYKSTHDLNDEQWGIVKDDHAKAVRDWLRKNHGSEYENKLTGVKTHIPKQSNILSLEIHAGWHPQGTVETEPDHITVKAVEDGRHQDGTSQGHKFHVYETKHFPVITEERIRKIKEETRAPGYVPKHTRPAPAPVTEAPPVPEKIRHVEKAENKLPDFSASRPSKPAEPVPHELTEKEKKKADKAERKATKKAAKDDALKYLQENGKKTSAVGNTEGTSTVRGKEKEKAASISGSKDQPHSRESSPERPSVRSPSRSPSRSVSGTVHHDTTGNHSVPPNKLASPSRKDSAHNTNSQSASPSRKNTLNAGQSHAKGSISSMSNSRLPSSASTKGRPSTKHVLSTASKAKAGGTNARSKSGSTVKSTTNPARSRFPTKKATTGGSTERANASSRNLSKSPLQSRPFRLTAPKATTSKVTPKNSASRSPSKSPSGTKKPSTAARVQRKTSQSRSPSPKLALSNQSVHATVANSAKPNTLRAATPLPVVQKSTGTKRP